MPPVQQATNTMSATETIIRSQQVQYVNEINTWQHCLSQAQTSGSGSGTDSYGDGGVSDSLRFWEQNTNMRASKLAHLAQDLLCAPASQAFVERVFSLCGILTAGRRSSMRKSLEMRVFLKLNQKVLKQTGFHL